MTKQGIVVFLASVVVSGCLDPVKIPGGPPDEVGRYVEGMVRFRLEQQRDTEEEPFFEASLLRDVEEFSEHVYEDCQEQLSDPEVLGNDGRDNPVLTDCPSWDDVADEPLAPTTCDQAVCLGMVSYCVAERLSEIAGLVEDYESTDYPLSPTSVERYMVPPQSPRANALLTRGAAQWLGRALEVSGANIESGMGVRTPGGVAVCTATMGSSEWLFYADEEDGRWLTDPFSDPEFLRGHGDALLSVVMDSAEFGTTLVRQVQREYSAVADAEFSDTTSASLAARLMWLDGRTSRAAAAHVLVGGDGGLFGVSNGYGSLGRLSDTQRRALRIIQGSGMNPALLDPASMTLVGDVRAALELVGELPSGELAVSDLLEGRGLVASDYARAAEWLANEQVVLRANVQKTLPDTIRYAATASAELVPPSVALVAGARHSAATVDQRSFDGRVNPSDARVSIAGSLSYAAEVVRRVSSAVTADTGFDATPEQIERLTEVLASAGAPAMQSTAGHFGVCNDGGSPAALSVLYSGRERVVDLVVVSGLDALRCAVTGTVHGADCDIEDEVWPAGATDTTSWPERAEVTKWTAPSSTTPVTEVYLLRVDRNDAGFAIAYRPIVGARVPTSVGCLDLPIVPVADNAAAALVTPEADDMGRSVGLAATSCAGIPSSQRIPLEDELTNDGDGFESSWRHYLTLARNAAEQADRLGEAVIENGLDVERRVEVATAELQSICGGAVDVDFLSNDAGTMGDAADCALRAEGETFQDGNRGYVCIGGQAMPDALETILARAAAGDVRADELKTCIGESERVQWASLGSRPLCLWEDEQGRACVGAREAGLSCPVVSTGDCVAQLGSVSVEGTVLARAAVYAGMNLEAVEVDENLGVFADLIEGTTMGMLTDAVEDEGGPPCDALRRMRGPVAGREQAMAEVMRSVWLTQLGISNEASRLDWEALPYDYGILRRDGREWAATGLPELGIYPAGVWPCGAPIDASLNAMDGACADDFGGAHAGPLGCAFAMSCTASGTQSGFLERVQMNQRVGRAALTLRLLTAEGLDGMRLPLMIRDTGGGAGEGDVEKYLWREQANPTVYSLPASAMYYAANGELLEPLVMGGMPTWTGESGTEVRARETDGVNNNTDRSGEGYCVVMTPCDPGRTDCDNTFGGTAVGGVSAANAGYLWTQLTQDVYDGTSGACTPQCLQDNTCSDCFRVFAPCFTSSVKVSAQRRGPFLAVSYSGDQAQPPSGAVDRATNEVWPGVGPFASAQDTTGVILRTFNHFVTGSGDPNDSAGVDESQYARRYFDERTSVRLLHDVTHGDVMDALELACESSRADLSADPSAPIGGVSNDACSPERLSNIEATGRADIAQMKDYLRCSADLIETNAERMVVRNVPLDLVRTVQSEFGGATLPVLEGERGVLIGEMTADVIALRTYRIQLARALREFAAEVETLENELERQGIQRSQMRINLAREVSNQMTQCVAASSPTVSSTGASFNVGAAIATCTNTRVQIGLAVKQLQNNLDLVDLDESDAFVRFNNAFSSGGETLGQIEVELVAAGHRLQAGFTRLENMREEARRALNQAMMFSSDAAGRQLRVNTLLRRRFTTAQDRYERARDHAVRMSFLAKLALEQRLGVRLRDLTGDMTLVEAPARWESRLCEMTGIDFERVRDGNDAELESYADQYIGDFVTRLEQVAESYRLDFPFHEGTDTAVVSMRDALLGVRASCPGGVESPNLVASSSSFTAEPWTVEGCIPVYLEDDEDTGLPQYGIRTCVARSTDVNTDAQLSTPSAPWLGAATPWHVRFGPVEVSTLLNPGDVISARATTSVSQSLGTLAAGDYIVSWYGRDVAGSPLQALNAVSIEADGQVVAAAAVSEGIYGGACSTMDNDGWCRHLRRFTLLRSSNVVVQVVPNDSDPATVSGAGVVFGPQEVELAGVQVEDVTRYVRDTSLTLDDLDPTPFVETNAHGLSDLPYCEDTDGLGFRSSGWRYDCERICPTGFRTDCPDDSAELACFWEHGFQINPQDLRSRSRLVNTGFAIGNYNYRMERVGLNFVGTGIRDCTDSQLPSGCFGSGFVNYSIEHLGPYPVTNHQGDQYMPPLFTGRVEYARGLAAERYLTNPLSSADRALIEPYARGEFRGRPLTGTYVVRIWDDGVVDFDQIEDVQIMLDYRYWTRFN